jgi:hypothetical protein
MVLDHIIGGGKDKLFRKYWLNTVLFAHGLLGIVNGLVDSLDGILEIFNITILGTDVLLPIELINVQGVCEVDIVITPQTTEVGNNSLTGLDVVIVKSPTLPLGQGEGYLEVNTGEVTWFECSGTLHPVEIVVEAGGTGYEERGRDADEVHILLEIFLESGLGEEKGLLELKTILEDRGVSTGEAVCVCVFMTQDMCGPRT